MIKKENSEGKCVNCLTRSTCVFSVLNEDGLRAVERMMQRGHYLDGEAVFLQGAPVEGLHILCQGMTKQLFATEDGRRLLIRFCSTGALLNGLSLPRHAFSAVSVGTSTVNFIDKAEAVELIERYPKLGAEMERRFAQDGQRLLQRMADLAYESVEERLAHVLLSLGQRHGVREKDNLRIDLPLSQQDLSEMVGTSRQAVNQELRKLTDHGLIREERCQITILDEQRLRDLK